ncbi:DUF2490 domain-containing protein [Chitinophaga sp. XS-30]|uniref:DUF2490 domain-containing protein n=1 Tax=Chitinophaga sp. XS-30 TaxID=2604421 RepID=UPI0011DCBFD2|nr:DUF2490 domain-containing protein [Chitinophaga sp. XS-30]QEH39695.1 DUF2490 domain-containing protein [Chitinophaga sp. XS-30]
MRRILIIGIFIISTTAARSQSTQFSSWLASFNTFSIKKTKLSIHLDVQARSTHEWREFQTFLVRPGLNYHFRSNMIATVGYGWVGARRTLDDVTAYLSEHRIWEQFIVGHKLDFIPVQHRFRVEQRFIGNPVVNNNELEKDGHELTHRFRYFLRGIIPFSGQGAFSKGPFAAVQNEIFLNFANTDAVNGKAFDQNRAYLAIGYRFSPRFDLETGYLNNYISGRNNAFTNIHVLQLAGYVRL